MRGTEHKASPCSLGEMSRPVVLLALTLTLLSACHAARSGVQREPLRAALVPGCPAHSDGSLSSCNWRRAAWATSLYRRGRVDRILFSGGPASNRVPEALAMKAGAVALGVPAEHIYTETQSRHTDENAAFSVPIAHHFGVDLVLAAGHGLQAAGLCAMVQIWGGLPCHPAPLDEALAQRVLSRLTAEQRAAVRVPPVPEHTWVPREAIAEEQGRLDSRARYLLLLLRGPAFAPQPPQPPRPEPTLFGGEE